MHELSTGVFGVPELSTEVRIRVESGQVWRAHWPHASIGAQTKGQINDDYRQNRIRGHARSARCDERLQDAAHHMTAGRGGESRADPVDPEEGATTVEYAIGTIAAAGFAGLLIVILKSDTVRAALESIIQEALSTR